MPDNTPITQQMVDSQLANVLHHGEPKDVFFYLRFVENPNVPTVNERFGDERLPVWTVLSGDHMHVNAGALLKLKPDVNVVNAKGQNPAMKAFDERHAGLGLMFLRAGTDLAARDANGVGLLKYIVDAGYPDALREALDLGLDVNQTVSVPYKNTAGQVAGSQLSGALAWAIAHENWDVLRVLIDHNIDRNPENPAVREAMKAAERLALIDPAKRAQVGDEKYKQLVDAARAKSDEFMRVITHGVFPESYAYEGLCKDTAAFQKRLVLLPPELQEKVLLDMGIVRAQDVGATEDERRKTFMPVTADEKLIFPKNKSAQTLLDSVLLADIKYGEAKDVYMWLKLGANPNASEARGGKPALFAAAEENLFEIKVAQKKEEIARTAKFNGLEPVYPDHLEDEFIEFKDSPYLKVKYLLDFGADPDTVHPIQKLSVLERAYGKGRLGIVQQLKKHGAKAVDGLLAYAAEVGEAQAVEDLFKPFTLLNGQQKDKLLSDDQIKKEAFGALETAVKRNKPRMVNVFYEQGLVPDANSQAGKALWEKANDADHTLVKSALEGHYFIQPQTQTKLTLNEKLAELDEAALYRLMSLMNVDLSGNWQSRLSDTLALHVQTPKAQRPDKSAGQGDTHASLQTQADNVPAVNTAPQTRQVPEAHETRPLMPPKKSGRMATVWHALRKFGGR